MRDIYLPTSLQSSCMELNTLGNNRFNRMSITFLESLKVSKLFYNNAHKLSEMKLSTKLTRLYLDHK